MALAVTTLLPTPWGWTSVYDLQAGDRLFDELGYPCKVTEVSEPYEDPNAHDFGIGAGWSHLKGRGTYNQRLVCSSDTEFHTYNHTWLKHHPEADIIPEWPKQTKIHRADTVATTMVGRIKTVNGVKYPVANHRIPIVQGLKLQRRDLILPPYILGVLINYYDYDARLLRITRKQWPQFSKNFTGYGAELTPSPNTHTGRGDARTTATLDEETQDIWDEMVENQKRLDYGPIPAEYLRGSETQRMELLSGLLDTTSSQRQKRARVRHAPYDSTRRFVSYTYSKSRYTTLQVAELVRTLGWPAIIQERQEIGRFLSRVRWNPQENIFPSAQRRAREAHRIGREGQPLRSYMWTIFDSQRTAATMRRFTVDSPHGLFGATETFLPVVSDRG